MTRVRNRRARARYGEHLSPCARFDLACGSGAVPPEGNSTWASPAERREAWRASRDWLIDDDRRGLEHLESYRQYEPHIPAPLRRKVQHGAWLLHPEPEPVKRRYVEHIEARRAWLRAHGMSVYAGTGAIL